MFDLLAGDSPDYYLVTDSRACKLWADEARQHRKVNGTQLITLRRLDSALKTRGVFDYDHFLAPSGEEGAPFQRGSYVFTSTSGQYCVQFAINNGAKTVHLIGLEGYDSTNKQDTEIDYFDGRAGPHNGPTHNARTAQFLRSLVEAVPDVKLRFYGRPRFPVSGPNLRVINTPDQAYRMKEPSPCT